MTDLYERTSTELPGLIAHPTEEVKTPKVTLPPGLDEIRVGDAHLFTVEVVFWNGTEVSVAKSVTTSQGEVSLDRLSAIQLRKFAGQLGVRYVSNCTKLKCRQGIAHALDYHGKVVKGDFLQTPDEARLRNTLLRVTNLIFSPRFFHRFLTLNDKKGRDEFEAHHLPKHFWEDVAKALEERDNDDLDQLQMVGRDDMDLQTLLEVEPSKIDLTNVDVLRADVLKKKIQSRGKKGRR